MQKKLKKLFTLNAKAKVECLKKLFTLNAKEAEKVVHPKCKRT